MSKRRGPQDHQAPSSSCMNFPIIGKEKGERGHPLLSFFDQFCRVRNTADARRSTAKSWWFPASDDGQSEFCADRPCSIRPDQFWETSAFEFLGNNAHGLFFFALPQFRPIVRQPAAALIRPSNSFRNSSLPSIQPRRAFSIWHDRSVGARSPWLAWETMDQDAISLTLRNEEKSGSSTFSVGELADLLEIGSFGH